MSFVVNNDIELLEKVRESENNYRKNGISYTFEESLYEHTNLINRFVQT